MRLKRLASLNSKYFIKELSIKTSVGIIFCEIQFVQSLQFSFTKFNS